MTPPVPGPRQELVRERDEAVRRRSMRPEIRQVDEVQDDYFNIILDATGHPRRIYNQVELDEYMPGS